MESNVWQDLVDGRIQPSSRPIDVSGAAKRTWPPVMLRDFVRAASASTTADVYPDTSIGDVADFLSSSHHAVIAVVDYDGYLMGAIVDSDVMALIQRDGMKALDYPVSEALQCARPVCSATDSPYVVAQMMRTRDWDRVAVAEQGRVVGVVGRRDLVEFVDA